MKKSQKIFISLLAICLLVIGVQAVVANTEVVAPVSVVKSILLKGSGPNINWLADGVSAQGFKVVWSKNSGPTYPTRAGDQYHYYAEPAKTTDILEAFSGSGIYYVRVCEYLGGKCGLYSNEIKVSLGENNEKGESPIACTLEYMPVCGEKQVQCIKAPCPSSIITYGNKCQLNAAKAKFLYAAECRQDEVKKAVASMDLGLRVKQLESQVLKLKKENKRLYSLIKNREAQIKKLKLSEK